MSKNFGPRLPTVHDRTTIIGKTGSGKTQFSSWLLSTQPFDRQPYIIFDYKYDELLTAVPNIREIDFSVNLKTLAKQKGLYIIHPLPGDDDERVTELLWKIWRHERIGLYFDEGTLIPGNSSAARSGPFQAIQQQGRSKRLPAITVTQRPSRVSPSCFSEASFFAFFYLHTAADIARVNDLGRENVMRDLAQDYHCKWYDVGRNQLTRFSPVPEKGDIIDMINRRLPAKRRLF